MKQFTFRKQTKGFTTFMKTEGGFTLIELLVVITIIAILSVVGMVAYSGVSKNARDSRRKSDLRSIKVALELYYQNNNAFPLSDWVHSTLPNPWISALNFNYMPNGMPQDPINTPGNPNTDTNAYNYAYWTPSGCPNLTQGQFFILAAQLENKNDPDRNEIKDYKYCDGGGLYSKYNWSGTSYIVNSF